MKARTQAFCIAAGFLSALFAGCGSGGDDGAPPPPASEAQGIWRGLVSIDGQAFPDAIGLIDNTGNGNIILGADDAQFSGDLQASQGALVGGGLGLYGTSGETRSLYALTDGLVTPGSRLTATLNSGGSISSTATLDLAYDTAYERPASMDLISGTWSETIATTYTRTLSIDGAGTITGSDSHGCVYSGTVRISNPEHNLYILKIDVRSCYNYAIPTGGLAALTDTGSTDDTLTAALVSTVGFVPKYSFVYQLTRQ